MGDVACHRCGTVQSAREIPTDQWVKDGREPWIVRWLCQACRDSYYRWFLHPGRYPGDVGYSPSG